MRNWRASSSDGSSIADSAIDEIVKFSVTMLDAAVDRPRERERERDTHDRDARSGNDLERRIVARGKHSPTTFKIGD